MVNRVLEEGQLAVKEQKPGKIRQAVTRILPFASVRQCDCIMVIGVVSRKMALRVKYLYEQMGEPKYVVSVGWSWRCEGAPAPASEGARVPDTSRG